MNTFILVPAIVFWSGMGVWATRVAMRYMLREEKLPITFSVSEVAFDLGCALIAGFLTWPIFLVQHLRKRIQIPHKDATNFFVRLSGYKGPLS